MHSEAGVIADMSIKNHLHGMMIVGPNEREYNKDYCNYNYNPPPRVLKCSSHEMDLVICMCHHYCYQTSPVNHLVRFRNGTLSFSLSFSNALLHWCHAAAGVTARTDGLF